MSLKKSIFDLSVFLLVSCLTNQAAFARESWQVVQGPYYSIMLPDRPASSHESYQEFLEARKNPPALPTDSKVYLADDSNIPCSKAAAGIKKVFHRIILQNQLEGFMSEGPGINLRIQCGSKDRGLLFASDRDNNISITSDIFKIAESEDQIAFSIAHEMSHALLGHGEKMRDNEKIEKSLRASSTADERTQYRLKSYKDKNEREKEADIHAAFLIWNAGYDPFEGSKTIRRTELHYVNAINLVMVATGLGSSHSSGKARISRIEQVIGSTGVPRNLPITQITDLEGVQKELDALD